MAGMVITVKGQDVHLRFDGQAWLDIEDEFGSLDDMYRKMAKDPKPMHTAMKLVEILSAAGARKYGGSGMKTAQLARDMSPKEMVEAKKAAMNAIHLGLRRKKADDEDEDIDVVKAELEREKQKNAEGCSTEEP